MITIDGDRVIVTEPDGRQRRLEIGSPEAFALISRAWLRSGWDAKYVYSFTWLGRPIIQLPEDLVRIQEVIYSLKPDVIIETGVAHGGSLVFYAGLCKLIGKGRVIGIDVEIRPHNRQAIEAHELASWIALIEGSSIDARVVDRVRTMVHRGDRVLVLLDSCHGKDHVRAELEHYAPLVSVDSYIVAMDGIMLDVAGAPRTKPDWTWNNPQTAVKEFLATHADFELCEPPFMFNEGQIRRRVTYWPSAFVRRMR